MRKSKEKKIVPTNFASNVGLGALLALGISFIFLLLASFLVISGTIPAGAMGALTAGLLFKSSLIGGFFAIYKHRSRALLVGLCQGALLYALTFLGGAFTETPSFFGPLSPALLFAALLGGAAAGFISARPKKRKI